MSTLAQIINTFMHDNTATKNASKSGQCDDAIREFCLCIAIFVGDNIAQIANMTNLVIWCTMIKLKCVERRIRYSIDSTKRNQKNLFSTNLIWIVVAAHAQAAIR